MNKKSVSKNQKLSKSRRLIFNFLLVLMPLILIFLFEIVLRIVGYGDNLSLFITHPDEIYKEYKVVNPEIGKKYFQKFEYSQPAKDIFLKKKPDDVFRIFVMGSSTVAGFPYDNNLMFSRILNERLKEAYPDKKIEVVNTSITAINSFSLLDYMPQILRESPDAILFYAGQNEFYGAFGVGSNEAVSHNPAMIALHMKMMNFRIYQLTKNLLGKVVGIARNAKTAKEKRGTLMSRIVKDADITYDSDLYKEGISNYERNLGMILAMAKQKHVPVFIGDLICNLRDIKPFKSVATDKLEKASDIYNKAVRLEKNRNYKEALENYSLARDYDCIRFRASSDINKIITRLSEEYSATLVPVNRVYAENSPNGIIGDNLLTEHVHPNIRGQFLMSETFFLSLVKSKLIADEVDVTSINSFTYFSKNYGYTFLDYLIGKHRITNLKYHWPFRDELSEYVDYRQVYKPTSYLDSLAFNVMANSEETLTNAHLELAERFYNSNEYQKAFEEYKALTMINPYWPQYFRRAADCLLNLSDLPRALDYYNQSNQYEETFYAHYRAGEIELIKNENQKAIQHFEKAAVLGNDEEKLNALSKLYIAYNYAGNADKAKNVQSEIKKLDSTREVTVPAKSYTYPMYVPAKVKDEIAQARNLLSEDNIDGAIKILKQSLELLDNHISNRLLGEIFFKNKDYQSSLYYLKRAYDDFSGDAPFLHYYIIACLSNGNKNDAEIALAHLKLVMPGYPEISKLEGYINGSN